VAKHGRTAALVAPFKPKDTALFAVISGFDAAYSAYNGYQSAIERYWTLKYLAQNDIQELDAVVMAGGLVRADTLPLVFRAIGADNLPRNARVRVKVNGCDLLTLDLHAAVLSRIDEAALASSSDDATDDDEAVSGPLTLAIDMSEGQGDSESAISSTTAAAAA
jgi:exoribonuclease II